ncbi:hypothetical protein [Actinomyces sp. ZJ308]|uniref:hypothetical protein n=1 Tax=Actinomyces sp. ZJ308 TaxID=2708342 RepID=UPI00141EC779|nr:hypothetical protein [Actinomyces sp. ZJ308]
MKKYVPALAMFAALCPWLCSCSSVNPEKASSYSPTQVETYLNQSVFCEVLSQDVLGNALSMRVNFFGYSHHFEYRSFQCEVKGRRSGDSGDSSLLINYAANGKLSNVGGRQKFDEIDGAGYAALNVAGTEGHGYIWFDSRNDNIHFAWLYPDGYVLDAVLFGNGFLYSADDPAIDGMRLIANAVIPAVPPVAAGSSQAYTSSVS